MEERQCWICFESESETNKEREEEKGKGKGKGERARWRWVSACNCRGDLQWAHEGCLLLWIDEKQKGQALRPVKCPQCLTEYVITYPAPAPLLRLAELGNSLINISFPYIAVSGVLYCGYISCVTYGFYAILQMLGPEESELLLWESPHLDWRMYVGLPLIPLSLVWARLDSFDSLLPFLPIVIFPNRALRFHWPPSPALIVSLLPWARIFYKVGRNSLQKWLFGPSMPSRSFWSRRNPNEEPAFPPPDNQQDLNNNNNNNNNNLNNLNNNLGPIRNQRIFINNPIRTIVGALLLPALSSTTGTLFLSGFVKNTFQRNILGGCLFIVVKDMLSLLYTYFWRKRQSQRTIRSHVPDRD